MARVTDKERKEFHELLDFAIRKLDQPKNVKKKHWSELAIPCLQKMLSVENAELDLAVNHGNIYDILSECDDLINFAMFIKHNIHKTHSIAELVKMKEVSNGN